MVLKESRTISHVASTETLTLTSTGQTTLTFSGTTPLKLALTDTTTTLTSVDASGLTNTGSGFAWTAPVLAAASTVLGSAAGVNTVDFSSTTKAVTYTGGTGVDTITFVSNNSAANVINLGAGADTVTLGYGMNVVTLGGGADTVIFTRAASNKNTYTTINDITTGSILSFTQLVSGAVSTTVPAKITLGSTAAFSDYCDAAAVSSGANVVNYFAYNGDTYLVLDLSTSTSFVNGTDEIVKLVGTATIASITSTGVITFA